jgi:hypothetical protein
MRKYINFSYLRIVVWLSLPVDDEPPTRLRQQPHPTHDREAGRCLSQSVGQLDPHRSPNCCSTVAICLEIQFTLKLASPTQKVLTTNEP